MGGKVLGQFLGDGSFPVSWASEVEKDFFWVYDDLHCPHPVSPMFFDIGGWWLSCDHMFRRFGTPFAVDWLAKNVNGYVYTTPVPPDPTTLRAMARSGGGAFLQSASAQGLNQVYQRLGSQLGTRKVRREITPAFAAGAVVLLLTGAGLSLRWFGRVI